MGTTYTKEVAKALIIAAALVGWLIGGLLL